MKKILLTILVVAFATILVLLIATKIINNSKSLIKPPPSRILKISNQEIFTPKDTECLGIEIDMKENKVKQILGKPEKIEKKFYGAFGAEVLTYFYRFGYITLEPYDKDYEVSLIYIDQPNFIGPRGIKVGDSSNSVINKFPNNKITGTTEDEDGKIKYLYRELGDKENSGYLSYGGGGSLDSIKYNYNGWGGFGTFTLLFRIKNDKVMSIMIHVMNV